MVKFHLNSPGAGLAVDVKTWEWLSLLSWVGAGPVDNTGRPSKNKGGSEWQWAIMCTLHRLIIKNVKMLNIKTETCVQRLSVQ